MESFTIKKDANFKDIEDSYKIVIENPNIKLRLPHALTSKGIFGIEGLVLLLIASWIRINKQNRTFHTFASNINDFSEICSSLYGICALRYSNRILTKGQDDEEIPREVALQDAYVRIRKIMNEDFINAVKDGYLAIPSFKAVGKNAEFQSPFYNNERLVSEEQFQLLVRKAIDAISNQTGVNIQLDNKRLNNIAAVVRELFGNTHKHARTDNEGNLLKDNFRAVIFNYKEIEPARLHYLIGAGGGPISLFGAQWQSTENLSLLEITVVDSGPGYARRWIKDIGDNPITIEEEKAAIVKCFTKHQSTDYRESAGSGLTNVLKDLKTLKGWFMLRTGSISVEKAFVFEKDKTEILLEDVKALRSSVEGVSFSVVIPLNDLLGEE